MPKSCNPAAFLDGVEKAANVFVLGREGAVEELKAVSFGTNEVGGLFDIEIFALPMDGGTGTVSIAGDGNYTGTSLCFAVNNIR
ncbi:MAG: hypothetical protein K6C95_09105 [Lachnospiraceae bacterium]|nr:hypothetical protein [Lachnospiraceae bacterium]